MLEEAGCVSRRMKVEWTIWKYISLKDEGYSAMI